MEKAWEDVISPVGFEDLITEDSINTRIESHKKAITHYKKEIELSKYSIKILEEKKNTIKNKYNADIFPLADLLHSLLCKKDHATECWYNHSNWDSFSNNVITDITGVRAFYYKEALRLVVYAQSLDVKLPVVLKLFSSLTTKAYET